ncbi:uncharacterized protein LOC127286157 isoform X2 [Leptopilina boulardi]|uniref:uncharacterized protein LOC127286157 isoform X2 n=1 Tax=Leptopilina boulardi TaxID=63433 RepID=UPI0021F69120|nr:uncharacterized protein LOC127286157 isoform X2 [Leptopilina boulardi]
MMNDTSVFVQLPPNIQYLSVCHYITTLGIIFYNESLITLNQRNQSVPVLNTYFKYLNNSNTETETKLQLLQTILKGTDLYGGGENETLDTKYVDETYQYIINNALFSHYGNINGYLAKIINKADNTSYSTLMKTIKQELFNNYTSIDYCSKTNKSPKLNFLSAKTIFSEYILPIFPEPENQDMNIMSVDYLYAMAGLKIVRSILGEKINVSFDNYISISREIDFQASYGNESYEMVFNLFSTPALFFYATKEKEAFRKKNQTLLNAEVRNEAYDILFSHINITINESINRTLNNNLFYRFRKELKDLKYRPFIATTILEKHCNYSHYKNNLPQFVNNYMSYNHYIVGLALPTGCFLDNLPNLEDVYRTQFENVGNTYFEIEKILIRKVLDDNHLIEILNRRSTVSLARVPDYPMYMTNIPPMAVKINPNVTLMFAIKERGKTNFYAFIHNDTLPTLLVKSNNEQEFGKLVANDPNAQMEINIVQNDLKSAHEDSEVFIERFANVRKANFLKNLMHQYRNETTKEKVFNFLKAFIPFYSCIESIQENDKVGAALGCTSDIVSLISLQSFFGKYATKITNNLVIGLSEKYVIKSSLSRIASATKLTTFYQISKALARTVLQEILTKQLLKDVSIALIQLIDPRFELVFKLSKLGSKLFHKMYNTMIQKIPKISMNKNLKLLLTTMLKKLNTNIELPITTNGLMPNVLHEEKNYKLFLHYYPGGEHFFGPKFISSFENTAELRTIEGNLLPVPVLPIKDNMNKISYRVYNPETNEISNLKFEMGENDLLRSNMPYLNSNADRKIIPTLPESEQPAIKGSLPTDNIPSTSNGLNLEISRATGQHIAKGELPTDNIPSTSNGLNLGNSRATKQHIVKKELYSTESLPNVDISKMGKKEIIQRLLPYFNLHEDTKIIKDYQVYHNTIELNKIPMKTSGTLQERVPSNNNFDNSKGSEELVHYNTNNGDNKLMNSANSGTSEERLSDFDHFYSGELGGEFWARIIFGDIEYGEILLSINDLKYEKFANLYKNKVKVLIIKKNLEKIRSIQDIVKHKMPRHLYFSQTLKEQNIVKYLEQLKGKDFYFNDITLLTDIPHGEIKLLNKVSANPLKTEVQYQIKINSQYGLVDLAEFETGFRNQFVVFPELEFTVENTEFVNGKDFLLVELKQKPILESDWLQNKKNYDILLQNKEITTYERSVNIENAANLISLNTPLHRLTEMEEMLKGYILRIDPIETRVPTYEMLAKEINTRITPCEIFNEWKITNHIFIDDVLFEKSLYQVKNLEDAKKTIANIFDKTYEQNVESVFEIFNSHSNEHSMLFEDYYVWYSHLKGTLPTSLHANTRLNAALNRLALRQCDDKFIQFPSTLYFAKKYDGDISQSLENIPFYSNVKDALKNTHRTNYVDKILLLELNFKNSFGIAYIDPYYFNVPKKLYYLTDTINFNILGKVEYEKENILRVIYNDFEIPKEKRMIKLVNNLNTLFSSDTKFYANLKPIVEGKLPTYRIPSTSKGLNFENSMKNGQPIVRGGLPTDDIPSTSKGLNFENSIKNGQPIVRGGLPTDDIPSTSKGLNFENSMKNGQPIVRGGNTIKNEQSVNKTPIKKKKPNADEHLNPDLSLVKNINSDSSLETMKNPPFGEINLKENFPAHRTGILMNSVQPLTKEILPQIPLNHYIDELGEESYNLYVESLKKFKKQGLQLIKEDKFTMQSVRLLLNYLSQFQNIDTILNEVKKLYFHQTVTNSIIIDNYLSKLEGSNFYFNDITLLNDIEPNNIINKKLSLTNTETEVLYRVNFHSKNGFINLAEFHDSFKNDYIVFPEISFNVHSVKFLNENRLLVLDLNQKSMPISVWMVIRKRDLILLDIEEIETTKIMKCIENAALSISSNFPVQRFRDMKIIFKKYILNTDQYTSIVPTYDKLAEVYSVNFKIPKNYKEFEIFNGPFIDDVLFYDKLHKINSLESAKQIINQLLSGVYLQNVESVFKMYQSVSLIKKQIRFEDYYVIYSYVSKTLSIDVNNQKQLTISLYRLALRQSMNEMLLKKPITLYAFFVVHKSNSYMPVFETMIACYSNREKVIKNFPLVKAGQKIILYEFEMFNEAGIANIGRVFPFEKDFYIIPQEVEFMNMRLHKEIINEKLFFTYKFREINLSQEKLIAKLAVRLNTLLS